MGPVKRTLGMLTLGLAGAWAAGSLKNFLGSSVIHEFQRKATENADSFCGNVVLPVYNWVGNQVTTGSLENIIDNMGVGLTLAGLYFLSDKAIDYGKREINIKTKY